MYRFQYEDERGGRQGRFAGTLQIRCACGHFNRPGYTNHETCKLILADQLPPCTRCGRPLPLSPLRNESFPGIFQAALAVELESRGISQASFNGMVGKSRLRIWQAARKRINDHEARAAAPDV